MAPSCGPAAPASSESSQQQAVAISLERLKPGHFQAKRLAFEIRDVGFTPAGSLGTLQQLVRWIYDRAVSDPERFSGPCASLCHSLTPILPNFKPPGAVTPAAKAKRIDFRQTLLNLCQREFEAACGQVSQQPAADVPVVKATVSSLTGSLQFLAYLYLHHLLTDRIMLSCLLLVSGGGSGAKANGQTANGGGSGADPLAGREGQQRVECLVRALTISGSQLDECLAAAHRPMLDGLYDQLHAVQQRHNSGSGSSNNGSGSSSNGSNGAAGVLPAELVAALGRLLDMREDGWRGAATTAAMGSPAPPSSAPAGASTNGGRVSANGGGAVPFPSLSPHSAAARSSPAGAGPGSAASRAAASASAPASAAWNPTSSSSSSSPVSSNANGGRMSASSAAAALRHPVLRRVHALNGSGGAVGGGGGSATLSSRGSSQNLDGLWNLTPETYSEVRAQLLSQPVANSPATLEALADELVECAMAASGGDVGCPCWGSSGASTSGGGGGLAPAPASTAGAVAGAPAAVEAAAQAAAPMSDEEWSKQVQQQWDEQYAACDIYVRLCVDALQHMGGGGGDAVGANGAASGSAAAAAGVTETGRTFRRFLLSSAQSHFERCLKALLNAASPPQPPTPTPSAGPQLASPQPVRPGAAAGAASAGVSPSPSPQPQAAASATAAAAAAATSGASGLVRAWSDMPAAAPDAASALPRARGICHLLLGLLRHGVLTPRIVLHCAAALVEGAAGGSRGAGGCTQCACIILAGAGKQAGTFKAAEAEAFESMLRRMRELPEAPEVPAADADALAPAAGAGSGNGRANGGSSDGSVNGDRTGAATAATTAEDVAAMAEQRRRFVAWLVAALPVAAK